MVQSAELMSELPTETDRITVLEDYDAMRPDTLQIIPEAAQFVRSIFDEGRPVAALCQGPWTLIDADAGPGRAKPSPRGPH
jgi:putative intracellular protease/amidase